MKFYRALLFSLAGWVGGATAIFLIFLVWPVVFPAILRMERYYGAGPSLRYILAMVLLASTPAALLGGAMGSRLPSEGGRKEQHVFAAIGGGCFALPFACGGFWFFTGW